MNLLPREYIGELKYEAWRRFVVSVGLYTALVGVVANALLLPSFLFLSFQIKDLKRELTTLQRSRLYQSVVDGETRVKNINRYIKSIVQFDKSGLRATAALEDIINTANSGITISSITLNGDDLVATVRGVADTRENALLFISDLEGKSYISRVPKPDNIILTQRNVQFSLTIDMIADNL